MFWVGVSDRVLLVLFLDADGTITENGALGAAVFLVLFESVPFLFTLKSGVYPRLAFQTMSLKNKVVNLFGGTNCFNLHGYSLTTLFKNCVVSGCGSAVSRGCNAVFTVITSSSG